MGTSLANSDMFLINSVKPVFPIFKSFLCHFECIQIHEQDFSSIALEQTSL